MTLIQKLLTLLCIGLSIHLQAMVRYDLLESPEEQMVLVLGEWHHLKDLKVIAHFKECITVMAKTPLTRPLPVTVEYEMSEDVRHEIDSDTIAFLVAMNETSQTGSLNFDFYDPRTSISASIQGLITVLAEMVLNGATQDDILKLYFDLKLLSKRFLEVQGYNEANVGQNSEEINAAWSENSKLVKERTAEGPTTLKDYFEYLNTNRAKMENLLSVHKENEALCTIIKRVIEKYTNTQAYILEIFKSFPEEQSLAFSIVSLFDRCSNSIERMHLYNLLSIKLQKQSDSLFADILFLDRILRKYSDEPCVCLIVGSDHAKNVAAHLKELGYTTHSERNDVLLDLGLLNSLKRNSSGALACHTMLSRETIQKFLAPLTKKEQTACWHCSKQSKLRCSRCKQARYCSPKCQKAHWKEHKKTCKKPSE